MNNEKNGITVIEMEKSGQILLTKEDLSSFRLGKVSDRVKELWNFSLSELQEVINSNYYKEI